MFVLSFNNFFFIFLVFSSKFSLKFSKYPKCFHVSIVSQVNLTLDCDKWGNDSTVAADEVSNSVSSVRAGRPTPRPSQCRESSISSASGLGIEPAMQAISVFSNMLRYAPSRDSIQSTGSCDDRRNYLGMFHIFFISKVCHFNS